MLVRNGDVGKGSGISTFGKFAPNRMISIPPCVWAFTTEVPVASDGRDIEAMARSRINAAADR